MSPTRRLAELLLADAGGLDEFVRSRRAAGRAWRLIARDLYEATGQEVDVTLETVRTWFLDEPDEAAS